MIYALIVIVALVAAMLLVLRTNTAVVFLAVCAGSVLLSAAGKDTDLLAHSFGSGTRVSNNVVQAVIVLLPGIISAILLRKRVSRHKLLIAVIPAVSSAVVGLTLVYPFLTGSFQSTLSASKGWSLLAQYYEVIVIVGIISSLLMVALTIPKHHADGRHKKGKH
jgi:Ni/Fe-hydrogenase subunit HybB-like protein